MRLRSSLPFPLSVFTMFKNAYQSGFLSIMYSIGSKPLQIWDKQVRVCVRVCVCARAVGHVNTRLVLATICTVQSAGLKVSHSPLTAQVRNGHIKRITDQDIQSLVIDIASSNVR